MGHGRSDWIKFAIESCRSDQLESRGYCVIDADEGEVVSIRSMA